MLSIIGRLPLKRLPSILAGRPDYEHHSMQHNDDVGATGIPITPEYEQGSSKLGSKDSQHQSSQFGSFLRDASRSRRNKSPQVSPRELRKLSWRQNDGGDTEALAQQVCAWILVFEMPGFVLVDSDIDMCRKLPQGTRSFQC